MGGPRRETAVDQRLRPLEVDESDVAPVPEDDVAIAPLQRRAGDDTSLAPLPPDIDPASNRLEPRQAVGIGQRRPALHLLHVLARVEIVTVLERAAEPFGQQAGHGGLAGSRDTHHDDDGLH